MTIQFYNGVKDERKTYGVEVGGGFVHAYQVNPDYTLEEVFIDDLEYNDRRVGDYVVDCDEETKEKVRCAMAHKEGWMHHTLVKEGDIFKVVKGKKYPIGMEFTVKKVYEFRGNTHYGSYTRNVIYVLGTDGTKVAYSNCEFVKGVSEYDYQPKAVEIEPSKDYVVPKWFISKSMTIPEDRKNTEKSWIARAVCGETEKAVKCMVDAGEEAYVIWVPKSILMECSEN